MFRLSEREEKRKADEIERKKAAARGIVMDHTDDLMIENTNRRDAEFEDATGLDAALGLLTLTDEVGGVTNPEKKMKAAYNAYYERMLPQMKMDYPNLKLSQYKERIFDAWKLAAENPMNRRKAAEVDP